MIEITKCQLAEATNATGAKGELLIGVLRERCKLAIKDGAVRVSGCGCKPPCTVDLRKFAALLKKESAIAQVMNLPLGANQPS